MSKKLKIDMWEDEMIRVEKIHADLIGRLPSKYIIGIKCFKTTKDLIKDASYYTGRTYKEQCDYYTDYLNNPKKSTYINTKYCNPAHKKRIYTYLDTAMLGGNPIGVSIEKMLKLTVNQIRFLLLHEIAHTILNTLNERKCDLFAISWMRKL